MKVNTAVHIKEFWESKQDPGAPVIQFKVKFQGRALSCDFCKDLYAGDVKPRPLSR